MILRKSTEIPHQDRCIIFDLDDTLVDSETLCNQAFIELIPDISYSLNDLILTNRGRKLERILQDIEANIGRKLSQDFETQYRTRVEQLFSEELKENQNVSYALSAIPYKKCVASSGPISKIRHALKTTGLDVYFGDNIYSSYDINSWKPAPDIFLHAASLMKVPVEGCIVIEDSLAGINAGLAASMTVLHYTKTRSIRHNSKVRNFDNMSLLPGIIEDAYSSY